MHGGCCLVVSPGRNHIHTTNLNGKERKERKRKGERVKESSRGRERDRQTEMVNQRLWSSVHVNNSINGHLLRLKQTNIEQGLK